MTVYALEDLSPVQRTYLGVLSLGLVSADQAGDARFRIEYITAVAHALVRNLSPDMFAIEGSAEPPRATDPFRAELRVAVIDLDRKGIIGIGTPQDLLILKPAAPDPDSAYGEVDLNRHPPIFDRYLSQRCMDELFACDAAHTYLMELYADSGEIWSRLYKEGYGNWR